MNLEKIKTIWAAFAKDNKIELLNKQRTVNDVTQTQFAVNYNTATEFFSWIAFSQQSTEKNSGITSVIIELKDKLKIDNFKLDFSIENPTDFESKMLDALYQFKGTALSLNNNFIKVDTQHIFDSTAEFDSVKSLLEQLKKY